MTKALRNPWLRLLDALALAVGLASVLVMLCGAASWRVLWPQAAVFVCVPLGYAPKRARLWLLLALAALCGALGWALSPLADSARLSFALIAAAVPLVTLPLLGTERMLPAQVALLVFHLVAGVLVYAPGMEAIASLVNALGSAQLVVLLYHINLSRLRDQCEGGPCPPRLLLGNLGLTTLASALVLALANLRDIWNAIKAGARALVRWLIALFSYTPERIDTEPLQAGEDPLQGLPVDRGGTSPFWELLEYVAIGAAIALAAYLAYRFVRALPAMVARLCAGVRALLSRYRDAVNADYTDETEPLKRADERELKDGGFASRLRRRLRRAPDWRGLDNRQRVRETYRRLSRRAQPKASLTAREALSGPLNAPQLAEAYDRARYSAHPVTDAEAEAARLALRNAPAKRREA